MQRETFIDEYQTFQHKPSILQLKTWPFLLGVTFEDICKWNMGGKKLLIAHTTIDKNIVVIFSVITPTRQPNRKTKRPKSTTSDKVGQPITLSTFSPTIPCQQAIVKQSNSTSPPDKS